MLKVINLPGCDWIQKNKMKVVSIVKIVARHYVHWDTINKIELTDRYFEIWQDLLPEGNDAFDK
ncbi:hypothetical protein D920_00059 [Enterococcus faecalis 13-SD-W-01]|nr:hypothetical protein D920_00059 [Enterococcus faecalis 13-SD-W-01]